MPAVPYHCNMNVHSRAKGHSATAAAAYRSAALVEDERTGQIHDYTRKGGVEHSEIVLPDGAPEWAVDRAKLWNAAELAERNKNGSDRAKACVCRELKLAFPAVLNLEARKEMVRAIAGEVSRRHQVPVEIAMHKPGREGDDRNFHAHLLISTRRLGPDGFGEKTRELDDMRNRGRKLVDDYRDQWAAMCCEKLRENGHHIDAERWRWGHLKKKDQADKALERGDHEYAREVLREEATIHQGPKATALERKGIKTEIGAVNDAIREAGARVDQERADMVAKIEDNPSLILENITQMQAVFDRRDIARELAKYVDDRDQFQDLLAHLETSAELIELKPVQGRHPARYSTRDMVEIERGLVERAERLAGANSHKVSQGKIDAAIGRVGTLNDEQKAAIRHVTDAGRLACVVGDAGTGKSFSMRVAKEAWEAQGFRVRGAALAGKAAEELESGSGIDSRTLASLEYAWKEGRDQLTSRDVLVIDEAGMIGSRQLARVLDAADKAGAKVVLLGDHKQLEAIEAGAAFRLIADRNGAAELTEIRRQREEWARAASKEFARGDVRKGLDAYRDRGHVHIVQSREDARTALAERYLSQGRHHGGSSIILAHANKDVAALNEALRQARQAAGELGASTTVMTTEGRREFAAGDRLMFRQNDRNLEVKNGTLGTVQAIEGTRFTVRLDDGREVEFDTGKYDHIDHGYAVTVNKAQGVSVDRAYVLATPGMGRNLGYVGMTRHKDSVELFAGQDDFGGRRTGRVIEHGQAPYEHNPENRDSYFVTLENDAGKQWTVWGVDLERAMAESGADIGDTIGLEHVGSRTVMVDGRETERNTWKVNRGEDLAYENLAKRLARERPKESTLDYVFDFADRRGFDGENVVRRWIERGRAKVAELAGKMQQAMRRNLDRHGRPDLMSATDLAGQPSTERPQQIEQPAAPQRSQGERQAPADPLAGFRAGVERAEAAGGGLALDVAKAQLAVAQEFQAAGKDPRHHTAEIMQEGQQRAVASQAQPVQAKTEPKRPAANQVSEQDRRRAELAAKQAVSQFKATAMKRQMRAAGYGDRGSAWARMTPEQREGIEKFNALPKERQERELDRMRKAIAERYARDPAAIARDRKQERSQERHR